MTSPASRHLRTRTAFTEWVIERADNLAAELHRAGTARDTRSALRLSAAAMAHCADFILEIEDAARDLPPSSTRLKHAEYLVLDVGQLRSSGYLERDGERGILSLWQEGLIVPMEIRARAGGDFDLRLGEDASGETVHVTATAPSFGGVRYWLVCPVCESRNLKLYRPVSGGRIACLSCQRLNGDAGWKSAKGRKLHIPVIQSES